MRSEQVYGGLPDPRAHADDAQLERFIVTARARRAPAIVGGRVTDEEDPTEVTQEYAVIRNIGDTLEYLTTFSDEVEGGIASAADDRMAIVADVHTDPNTSQVLEEGVGDAFPIYVVVLVEGQQVVTPGGVFSYYEFKQPTSNRLTDEAWQAMEPKPARPAWTGSFIVE